MKCKKRLQPGQLISISGVDGSGKSTQIDRLSEVLKGRGLSVAVKWHRPGYSVRLNSIRRFIRFLRSDAIPAADPKDSRRLEVFRNPRVQLVWVAVALLDSWFEYAIVARAMLLKHDVVIYDRHLADAELDLLLNFPEQGEIVRFGYPVIQASMRKPDCSILLDLDLRVSEQRRSLKDEPFPETRHEALNRHQLYRPHLDRWSSAVVVDAAGSESGVASEVEAAIGLPVGKA